MGLYVRARQVGQSLQAQAARAEKDPNPLLQSYDESAMVIRMLIEAMQACTVRSVLIRGRTVE